MLKSASGRWCPKNFCRSGAKREDTHDSTENPGWVGHIRGHKRLKLASVHFPPSLKLSYFRYNLIVSGRGTCVKPSIVPPDLLQTLTSWSVSRLRPPDPPDCQWMSTLSQQVVCTSEKSKTLKLKPGINWENVSHKDKKTNICLIVPEANLTNISFQ